VSIPVDLAALADQISRCGSSALLVTTSTTGPPHIASVIVTLDGECLVMRAGKKTHANAAEHPAVALVWTAGLDDGYCLIVDAIAQQELVPAETLVVEPTAAVLHRLAAAPTGS
jgi:hypothetical protein